MNQLGQDMIAAEVQVGRRLCAAHSLSEAGDQSRFAHRVSGVRSSLVSVGRLTLSIDAWGACGATAGLVSEVIRLAVWPRATTKAGPISPEPQTLRGRRDTPGGRGVSFGPVPLCVCSGIECSGLVAAPE